MLYKVAELVQAPHTMLENQIKRFHKYEYNHKRKYKYVTNKNEFKALCLCAKSFTFNSKEEELAQTHDVMLKTAFLKGLTIFSTRTVF